LTIKDLNIKEKQQNIVAVFSFPECSKRSSCQTIGMTTQTFIKIMQNGLLRVEWGCLPRCIKWMLIIRKLLLSTNWLFSINYEIHNVV